MLSANTILPKIRGTFHVFKERYFRNSGSVVYEAEYKMKHEYVDKIIEKNAKWLYDDNNYTKNHNHGIFQDGSLLKAGYYFDKREYIDKAINRLTQQLEYAFPNKQVHIENSSGYHLGILSYLKNITEFLNKIDNDYGQVTAEYLDGAIDYLVYVVKPNIGLPPIGDTIGAGRLYDDFGNPQLKYVYSQGKEGVKPKHNTRIYFNDGYAIFREHWDPTRFIDSTWLLFKSGYSSSTHKHADDLSFILYSKGKDIFVDPGMYNYMVGDRIADYMNSAHAHNTVIVDNKTYSIGVFNSKKVGLYDYKRYDDYEVVTGFNNIYQGVNIDRNIIYLDGSHFLIVDDIISNDRHDYSQLFHLSNDVSILELSDHEVVLEIMGTDYVVLLHQLEKVDSLELYNGDKNKNRISYISTGFSKAQASTTLEFRRSEKDTRFITSIRIINQDELKFYKMNKPIVKEDYIYIDDIVIPISSRKRLPNMNIQVEFKDNNEVIIKNLAKSHETLSHSFYLIDKESGKKYDSRSYYNSNQAEFKLEEEGRYALMAYQKNNSNETLKKLIGFIEKNHNDQYVFIELPLEEQEPRVVGNSLEKVTDRLYRFNVDIQHMNKINSKWYIYKNGASYDFVGNSDLELEYEFKEPGEYTVIYRINDIYFGEVEYNHFEKIIID